MADVTRWIVPRGGRAQVERLVDELGIHPLAARVLVQRGYAEPEIAARFLDSSLDALHDPYRLRGMKAAAARLAAAVAAREPVLLYGDYDVDGTCSIVILKKMIEIAGGQARFHVPDRLREGYGMRADVIETYAAEGVRLVVSVDTGIRACEAVARATELGVDVVVTDHHLPEEALPKALAIVNPNQPGCEYPEKSLCGAGVAFKLAHALMLELGWEQARIRRMLESLLKLVAIATVADVVPLTGENRVIVRHGLAGLGDVRNPGMKALLSVAGITDGSTPTAGQVAFRIAPRLNAAGRMASAADVIELFLTNDAARAEALAAQLHALNHERQQTENDIVQRILGECARQPVTEDQMALVFCGKDWHRGVLGIVANRLVENFHRPVFVLSDEGDGEAQGSGRSISPFHLLEALESMPELFTRFGGHRQAAGLTLPLHHVDEFRRRVNVYAAERLKPEDLVTTLAIDAEFDFSELTDAAVAGVLALEPFGFGNPAPLFAVRGVVVRDAPSLLKEKHLRVRLAQNGKAIMTKAWNFAGRLAELERGTKIDAVLTFEHDAYSASRGYAPWSATLRDVRAAGD